VFRPLVLTLGCRAPQACRLVSVPHHLIQGDYGYPQLLAEPEDGQKSQACEFVRLAAPNSEPTSGLGNGQRCR